MQKLHLKTWVFLGFIMFLTACSSQGNKNGKQQMYLLKNAGIQKEFVIPGPHSGPLYVNISNSDGENVARTNVHVPYFEFIINNEYIGASDSIWEYKGVQTREMPGNGSEHILAFSVAGGKFKGLQVNIYQQVFDDGTLIREKLEITAEEGLKFTLNKREDRLFFRFPQYIIASDDLSSSATTEIRMAGWNSKPITFHREKDAEDKSNHMYYPEITTSPIQSKAQFFKGPFLLTQTPEFTFGLAYEHASQDNTNGMLDQSKVPDDGRIVDAMQGTKGVFDFEIKDSDFMFLGLKSHQKDSFLITGIHALRGVYLEGEEITAENTFETVWNTHFMHGGNSFDTTKIVIHDYLLNKITEKTASRKPEFYYNTWGMQRASEELRDVLNYENIFKEIEYAAQLGVDIFVLDDGWQQNFGIWKPHSKRLPNGLSPVKEKLDAHGMKLGIWLSPPTIDSTTHRYKEHPEWVIKDSRGNPIQAQWGHCAFDMVSDYQQLFIEDCKWLIDQGADFFKWDAINTFFSTLPGLHHGSELYTLEERRARYEYLLPIYVTDAMKELTYYAPELIIEVDLTEARRVMTGLAPLSQGKLFWMNNGASGYNDYSPYRTQSMRTIPNEFAGIIPLELFTYANYPHDIEGSQDYNVNTSLISGHGFWGKLDLMTETERLKVGAKVKAAKMVLPYLTETIPEIMGSVGNSPEIYIQMNIAAGAGQIVGFTSTPEGNVPVKTTIDSSKIKLLLHAAYQIKKNILTVNLNLDKPYSSQVAFVLPADDAGFSITQSSSPISNFESDNRRISYTSPPGEQYFVFDGTTVNPEVMTRDDVTAELKKQNGNTMLRIEVSTETKVQITY